MPREKDLSANVIQWKKVMIGDGPASPQCQNLCIIHNIFEREFTYINFDGGNTDVLKDFLERVGEKCVSLNCQDPASARDLIDDVLHEYEKKGTLLGLAGKTVTGNIKHVSRVVSALDFITYNLSDIRKKMYSSRRDGGLARLARHLQNYSKHGDIIRSLKGTIRGRFAWAFVTQSTALVGLTVEEITVQLGKTLDAGVHWIEVVYPHDFTESMQLRAPTILSAGNNALFRAERLDKHGWGRAVLTDNFEKGLPEAVHEECAINKLFDLRYLGYTKIEISFDRWQDFIKYNKSHI